MASDTKHTVSRREALRLMGNVAGAVALGTLVSCTPGAEVSEDFPPTQVASADELLGDGDYVEAIVGGAPVAVLASAQPVAGAVVKEGQQTLYIVAFSRVCKHNGCTINAPESGVLICPCHGSRYSQTDGSVLQGPAEEALAQYQLRLEEDGGVIATGLVRL